MLLMKPSGLPIGLTGLDTQRDSPFHSQEEVWLDRAQACQFVA